MSQTVATAVGRLYDLTFHVGNVVNVGGPLGTTSTVQVFVNGVPLLPLVPLMTAVNNSGAPSKQVWRKFGATLKAPTGSETTITFINGDPSSDNLCGLDDVSLTPLFAIGE